MTTERARVEKIQKALDEVLLIIFDYDGYRITDISFLPEESTITDLSISYSVLRDGEIARFKVDEGNEQIRMDPSARILLPTDSPAHPFITVPYVGTPTSSAYGALEALVDFEPWKPEFNPEDRKVIGAYAGINSLPEQLRLLPEHPE